MTSTSFLRLCLLPLGLTLVAQPSHPLRVVVTPYPLDRADQALADLAADRVTGAAVLIPS